MHAARYTAGTEFYLARGDIRTTQQLLGREDIGTTADIYVQPNEASLERKRAEVCESGGADDDSARLPPNGIRSSRRIAISRENMMMEAAGIEPASAAAPDERLQA
jgi:hypothetical protein